MVYQVCPYHRICGSCDYEQDDYETQKAAKEALVQELLGGRVELEPMLGMNFPYYYRNKVHYALGVNREGLAYAGLYQAYSHQIIDIDRCLIEDTRAQRIVKTLVAMIRAYGYPIYDEDLGEGLFRRILLRTSYKKHQVMVTLVLADKELPGSRKFIRELVDKHLEITSVVINVNDKDTSYILGDDEKIVYGPGYIEDVLLGKTFRISSKSFYQVNPIQTAKLYQKALDYAGLTGQEKVIDAYSGIGTIGILAADQAQSVIGVESNPQAVKDAITNAKINQVKNIYFQKADASDFMEALAKQGEKVDLVLTDPPREGSDTRFIRAVKNLQPEKVVYISCEPESLQRDLREFETIGYRLTRAATVDMFPWTQHVETVALLSRK